MSDTEVPVDRLVRVYIKMRDALTAMRKRHEEEELNLTGQMDKVKGALLEYCKTNNVDSVRTPSGLFYRTTATKYGTNDWESMGKFILEYGVPELLEKRIHQGNMKQFLQDHPDVLPPGLNVDSEYSITVRRK